AAQQYLILHRNIPTIEESSHAPWAWVASVDAVFGPVSAMRDRLILDPIHQMPGLNTLNKS
ncbi:MAG: hypothetical protein KI789_01470, partial [Hoeflea sp.]|nr:hypothetical protein [Hoeflea sp.]